MVMLQQQERERAVPAAAEVRESRLLHLSRWTPGNLMAGWSTYWVALVLAIIGPAIPMLWRLSKDGSHGDASVSMGDGALKIVISEGLSHIWKQQIGLTSLALAIAIPPLILWGFWLRAQRKEPPRPQRSSNTVSP